MKPIDSWLKIAEIHADRLNYAILKLKDKIPVSKETMANLPNEDVPIFELYASRFAKLQDFMGNTLFTVVLQAGGEQTETMTFLDKLNKLEKLNLITSAAEWMHMRQIRNSLSHEYPDHPELTARFFNEAYSLGPKLLTTLTTITDFLTKP